MKYALPISCMAALLAASSADAVSLMQIDTFDSTSLNWNGGGTHAHVAGGGPGGPADGYHSVVQASFHLGAKNTAQWSGDYIAAGVTAIEMDLNAFSFEDNGGPQGPGPTTPLMYVMLNGPGGAWVSGTPVSLTPGTGWEHAQFGISAGDLVYLSGGTGDVNATLSAVATVLIRHDYPSPTIPGGHPAHATATLGIDNIQAVPEPGSGVLALVAGAAALRRRRR